MSALPASAPAADLPLYAQVKDCVRRLILNGEWRIDHRIPSENELVRSLGASRMTVNRVLRGLTDDGWLRRVQGQGAFVSDTRTCLELLDIRNIADVIRSRAACRCAIFLHERAAAPDDIDLHQQTPNEYLMRAAPLSNVEHRLEAALSDRLAQRLLTIGRHAPCLLLHRRTWSSRSGRVVRVADPPERSLLPVNYLSARFTLYGDQTAFGERSETPL